MKIDQSIDQSFAKKLFETAYLLAKVNLPEIIGCLGIKGFAGSQMDVFYFSRSSPIVSMEPEVRGYLENIETKALPDSDRFILGTPHPIVGVRVEKLTVACWMPLKDKEWREAVSIVYGAYHELKIKRGYDDVLVNIQVPFLVECWQKKIVNSPRNEKVGALVEALFKKTSFKIKAP